MSEANRDTERELPGVAEELSKPGRYGSSQDSEPRRRSLLSRADAYLSSMARAVASEGTEWWRAVLRSIPGEIGCWLRAHLWGVRAGRGTRILTGVVIYYPERLNLGSNVGIACGAQLNGGGQIDIGNDVFIGPGSIIWSQNHGFRFRDVLIAHQPYERAKVTIGDDVWIGGGAIILPGVHIAEGTVVGAGSVVTMSTSPFSIVAGVPAREIDVRSSSHHRQAAQNTSMSTAV